MKLVTYADGTDSEIAGILTPDETGVIPLALIEPGFSSLQTFIEAAEEGTHNPYPIRIALLDPMTRRFGCTLLLLP